MSASNNSVLKPLAPKIRQKKESSELVSSTTQVKAGKRKACAFHPTLGYAIPPPVPAKVARRNARERNRVKQVNGGFEMLRTHIPSAAKHKKMSKVDTLRHAVEYIQSLQRMLNRNSTDSSTEDLEEDHCLAEEDSTNIVKVETPLSPPPEPQAFGAAENYESGYETASYYSSCNSMISPVPQQQNYLYNGDQQYFNYYPTQPHPNNLSIEPNSEEDELLDAIANWQDSS